ncbi:hypothetical protein [Kitasatospora sp. NPDC050463]|uniref:hypothetical protein n=1 Tax=Kitasatospora sp. NPDC050463 TaxID=3155786 RepID=UPI0033CB0EC1
MADRTISSPEQPEAESGSAGYCRTCGDYGFGTYDGIRTGLTDWIADHMGCRLAESADSSRSARDPGDIWA